ncbi:MAG: hypothetical protein JWR69_4049, partial [Pedosphaera sp.]|nr:hypothetical protein [Pedosphaera sp.]
SSSFDVPGTTSLKISSVGTNVVVSWTPGATLGTLLQATNVTGPWTSVGAFAPIYQVPPSGSSKFFRLSFTE